jgi:hypothetical protein
MIGAFWLQEQAYINSSIFRISFCKLEFELQNPFSYAGPGYTIPHKVGSLQQTAHYVYSFRSLFSHLQALAIMLGKTKSLPEANDEKLEEAIATAVENVASESNSVVPRTGEAANELTLRKVLRHHPALVWWSFYWAMAGVAW